MPYIAHWDELPEVEVLPNNFRRSAAGLQSSVNRIRLVHPSSTPLHRHDAEEQMVMMIDGQMDVTIEGSSHRMTAGTVCVIPAGTEHCFTTVEGQAEFLETFAPGRIQNLVGFLGKIF